jgi:hypothetical protein
MKRVETRSWSTEHRGPLLIHAAKKWDRTLADTARSSPFREALATLGIAHHRGGDDRLHNRAAWNLPFGAIIGVVDLVDVVPTSQVFVCRELGFTGPFVTKRGQLDISPQEQAFGDYSPGRFAWVCRNPVRFEVPIPYTGNRRLFEVPEEVVTKAIQEACGDSARLNHKFSPSSSGE